MSRRLLTQIALGAVMFAAAVFVGAALLTVLTERPAAPAPSAEASDKPSPTYSLCTPTSGGVLPTNAVREPLPRGGADEVIRQADNLVLSGQTSAAEELYRQRLDQVPTDACAARGLAYLAALSAPEPTTGAAALVDGWDAFYEAVVAPLWRLLLPFLVAFVVLLLAARVATRFVVGPNQESPDRDKETGLTARRVIYGVGLAFLVVAALGSVLIPAAEPPDAVRWFGWFEIVAMALAGVWLTAWGRGLALRVQIEGRDAEGKTTAMGSHVLVRLQQLGSERPRGLAIPQQTDVSSLPEDAVTALPQGEPAKALFRVLRLATPVVPWRATVTKIDGGAVVEIVRNGRPVDSTPIQFAAPPTKGAEGQTAPSARPGSDSDLATAAAAFILATLARRHSALRLGLAGATRWRSIYLQVRALSAVTEPTRQKPMLAQSVDADPGNLAARLALLHVDGRRASTAPAIEAYAKGLDDLLRRSWPEYAENGWRAARPRAGWTALNVRMLFNLATAWTNHYLVRLESGESPEAARDSWSRAWDAVRLLTAVVQLPHRGTDVEDLVSDLTPATMYLRAGIVALAEEGWTDPETNPNVEALSLTAVYTRACLNAILARRDPAALTLALDDLEAASALAGNREWAREDPSFLIFRRATTQPEVRRRYAKIVGLAVPTQFLQLGPFAGHTEQLTACGIRTHEDLLAADRSQLTSGLQLTPLVVGRWRGIAELARIRRAPSQDPLSIDVLFLLLAAEIDSVQRLRDARRNAAELGEKLSSLARVHAIIAPTEAEIADWQVP